MSNSLHRNLRLYFQKEWNPAQKFIRHISTPFATHCQQEFRVDPATVRKYELPVTVHPFLSVLCEERGVASFDDCTVEAHWRVAYVSEFPLACFVLEGFPDIATRMGLDVTIKRHCSVTERHATEQYPVHVTRMLGLLDAICRRQRAEEKFVQFMGAPVLCIF